MGIHITEEFKHALEALESRKNVLLTGRAGTGKSTLLRMFIERNTHRNLLITAPTGVAALNIGGTTIHKTFGFRPGLYPDDLQPGGSYFPSARVTAVLEAVDVLVVDEISMVRADLFDMMDIALRRIRTSDTPFGGVQLVLVGDLLQLPPVLPDYERDMFLKFWDTPYFFSAKCYQELQLTQVELRQVWRQTDPEFVEVLNQVREGSVSEEVLELLNHRVDPDFVPDEEWVTLTSRRSTVEQINQERLSSLAGEKFRSVAETQGQVEVKDFPGNVSLDYARGARVMTVVNDSSGDFVNGSFGVITDATEKEISIALDDGKLVVVEKHLWESKRPSLEGGRLSSEVVGTIRQFPIILAWAITIHKSQGKTIPKCFINLKGGTTTEGQFYVALSRAVDLENLRFNQQVLAKNINADGSLVRMIQRESSAEADTSRMVFMSFDGVDFSVSKHIARVHVVIIEGDRKVADFGTWINPMSDLGTFGEQHAIPNAGLALAPSLGEFWPLLLRQAAGGLVIADKLAMFERAVRHQEKGMEIGLGIGYDISDLEYTPRGDGVVARVYDMADAYLRGDFTPHRGVTVPNASLDTEGSVYIPDWAPKESLMLDPARATDSDIAWASLSGAARRADSRAEVVEALEIMSDWAISRGGWGPGQHQELLKRASRTIEGEVDLPDPQMLTVDPAQLFTPGTRVAFTGQISLNGQVLRKDDELAPICTDLGLEYKKSMSKSKCDLLVAGDVASMSRKAQAAREYGKPVVSAADFESWYNNPQPAVPSTGSLAEVPLPDTYDSTAAPSEIVPAVVEDSTAPTVINGPSSRAPVEILEAGCRVAFRGSVYIEGQRYAHGEQLQQLCRNLGLEYKQAVTRTRCDVLISDDPEAMDGKAKLAASYGKPVVLMDEFQRWALPRLSEQSESTEISAPSELEEFPISSPQNAPLDVKEVSSQVTGHDHDNKVIAPEVVESPEFVDPAPQPVDAAPPTSEPTLNIMEKLFRGRTFNEFNRPDDAFALIAGETAWLCRSRAELIERLGAVAAPEHIEQQPQPAYGRRFGFSMMAAFLVFWIGAFIGAAGADAIGITLVLASFAILFFGFYSAIKWFLTRRKRSIDQSRKAPLPLERSLGGPLERELPVLIYELHALSAVQRSAAMELSGLHGWLHAQGRPLSPQEWRDLTDSTLESISTYESSGDSTLVEQAARRIDQKVNR
ncbi:AAA family ATPase [Corynebacterium sp. A21]|uniref:AAA family ATPase n=1 Tax=Corynebacterium sp. A21 TaxID=3457318 RepID=UPI003FCF7CC4